jgi:preprotein translocase subunit SecG
LSNAAAVYSRNVHTAFLVVQIILALVLMAAILLQARGSGFSAFGSSDSSIYHTRRGFEKTLFQFTILVAVLWSLISIASAAIP